MSLMRTLRGSRCCRVKRVRVVILCSLPSCSLMSWLNISPLFFPTSPILTNQLTIQTFSSASTTSMGRSFRENPCEPARCSGMSGRMANPAPNTGYEPTPSNFFSYMDTEHTPIHLPDSHHDFQCQDDAAVISTTDPEGLPRSGASSSSKQTAAGRVPSMFGPCCLWKQMAGHVSGRPGLQEIGWFRTEYLLQQRFSKSQTKGKRD